MENTPRKDSNPSELEYFEDNYINPSIVRPQDIPKLMFELAALPFSLRPAEEPLQVYDTDEII